MGSETAFQQLFIAYRDKLYNYIFKLSASAHTASDTVHEVFLILWQRREKALEIDNLNSYLFRMAHNKALEVFRRRAKETLVIAALQKEQGGQAGFENEDHITHKEVMAFIRAAIQKLTPQQKLVFLMSRQEGLAHTAIADKLGITERTVKNHMTQALKFLREEIKDAYGDLSLILFILYQVESAGELIMSA